MLIKRKRLWHQNFRRGDFAYKSKVLVDTLIGKVKITYLPRLSKAGYKEIFKENILCILRLKLIHQRSRFMVEPQNKR